MGLLAEGRLDRTLRVLDRADSLCPASARESLTTRLRTLLELGRTEDARRIADTIDASMDAPADARASAREARASMAAREVKLPDEQAKVDARKAFDAAALAARNQEFEKAKRGFLKAWSLDPLNGRALVEAGLAAKAMGERADAQRLFDRAMVEVERATGKHVVLEFPSGPRADPGLSWSMDSRLLALVVNDAVEIRDEQLDFREIVRLNSSGASTVAFSPDGKLLAVGSSEGEDNVVHLWDVTTWTETRRLLHRPLPPLCLQPLKEYLKSVAFSPDGRILASQSNDGAIGGNVRLWDVSTGTELHVLKDSSGGSTPVVFSPDGEFLAMGSWTEGLLRWSVRTGRALHAWNVWPGRALHMPGPKGQVVAFVFSPDGKLLVITVGRLVYIWDVAKGREVRSFEVGNRDHLFSVAFSSDGRFFAAGSFTGVRLWDVATWALVAHIKREGRGRLQPRSEMRVYKVAFSPDGKNLAADERDAVHLLDVAKGSLVRSFEPLPGVSASGAIALSQDGTRMASVSSQNNVRFWTLTRGGETREVERYPNNVVAMALSPDGETLASSAFGPLHLQRLPAGHAPTLELLPEPSTAVAFSPDGKTLASAGQSLSVWDVTSGALVRNLDSSLNLAIFSLAFSPDSKLLAFSSDDGVLRFWNVATGALVHDIEMRLSERIWRIWMPLAFSPDGKTFAFGGEALRLLNVVTAAPVRTFEGRKAPIRVVAFSPDGKTLATSSYDKTTHLWNLATGAETQVIQVPETVDSVAFGGRLLAISDGTIHLWKAGGASLLDLVGIEDHDAGYAITTGGELRFELLGPDLEAASASLLCRAGVHVFPLELCRERFEVPGLVAEVLAGNASFVDP